MTPRDTILVVTPFWPAVLCLFVRMRRTHCYHVSLERILAVPLLPLSPHPRALVSRLALCYLLAGDAADEKDAAGGAAAEKEAAVVAAPNCVHAVHDVRAAEAISSAEAEAEAQRVVADRAATSLSGTPLRREGTFANGDYVGERLDGCAQVKSNARTRTSGEDHLKDSKDVRELRDDAFGAFAF